MKIIYTKADVERHREFGSEGGKKSAQRLTKAERRARARKAAQTRWSSKKEEVAQ